MAANNLKQVITPYYEGAKAATPIYEGLRKDDRRNKGELNKIKTQKLLHILNL